MKNNMLASHNIYFVLLGALGWALTLYFGFFRFKHYVWAKRKVQFDLFTKINQNNHNLFLKVMTLTSIKNANAKVSAKRQGVLIKYLENFHEKIFLMKSQLVSKEIGQFWINGMINELQILSNKDENFLQDLKVVYHKTNTPNNRLEPLFGVIEKAETTTPQALERLYQELIK